MLTLAVALWLLPTDLTVHAGGTDVAVRCEGTRAVGQPLVVLEAGGGDDLTVWSLVLPQISEFARVCAYSRPTLIRNGVGPRAGSSPAQIVQTLREVLSGLGEAPPHVLVGHSYGGMIVRLYASAYPRDVTGMVLVDSSHEDQIARFEAIDPEVSKQLRAPSQSEALDLVAVSATLNDRRWRGDIPLVVLTHGAAPTPQPGREAQTNGLEQVWLELQRDLASRSTHSTHTIAAKSGHYIHRQEPALVIDAVHRVVSGRP